jgi:hypothetical protein
MKVLEPVWLFRFRGRLTKGRGFLSNAQGHQYHFVKTDIPRTLMRCSRALGLGLERDHFPVLNMFTDETDGANRPANAGQYGLSFQGAVDGYEAWAASLITRSKVPGATFRNRPFRFNETAMLMVGL